MGAPLVEAAMALLREHGPLSTREWAQLLTAEGHGYIGEMTELAEYLEHPMLGALPDERNIALDTLLEQRVLTHRLTDAEIASGILDANPDLAPLTVLALAEDGYDADFSIIFRGIDDEVFDQRGVENPDWPADEALLLEPGTLDGFAAGDLITLSAEDGSLRLRPVDVSLRPAPSLAGPLVRTVPADAMEDLDTVLWQLMHDDPSLFTEPTVPLGELIADAGFTHSGDSIAADGFDFAAQHARDRVQMVSSLYELDEDHARAAIAFVDLVHAIADAGEDEGALADATISADPEAYAALIEPGAARAVLDRILGSSDSGAAPLCVAATSMLRHGPRRAAAVAHWFLGKAAERACHVEEAEQHLEAAVTANPRWEPALFDLARYASDRGDASRALSLLGRIEDGHTEPLYALLTRYLPVDRPDIGRNDPCWCGSGRKYKVCHRGRTEFSLDERAQWLYQKAGLFLQELEWRHLTLALAEIRAEHWEDDPYALVRAFEDGLAEDVALFEGGVFDEFLARRGAFLPEDEQLLARRWAQVKRSVYEVEAVRPGEGFTLHDLRTGDRHEVTEHTASIRLQVGDLFCARVVPAGSTTRIFGGIEPVSQDQRAALIDLLDSEATDPDELVAFLSARFASTHS